VRRVLKKTIKRMLELKTAYQSSANQN